MSLSDATIGYLRELAGRMGEQDLRRVRAGKFCPENWTTERVEALERIVKKLDAEKAKT